MRKVVRVVNKGIVLYIFVECRDIDKCEKKMFMKHRFISGYERAVV